MWGGADAQLPKTHREIRGTSRLGETIPEIVSRWIPGLHWINGKRELGSLFCNPCKPLGDPSQHSRSAIAEDQDHTRYEDATFIGVS